MLKYLVALVLLVSCNCSAPAKVVQQEPEDVAVTDLVKRTVLVRTNCLDGSWFTGSGVVLESGVIATAAHLIPEDLACNFSVERHTGEVHLVFRTKEDRTHDVALMWTLDFWGGEEVELARASLGQRVIAVGYPKDLVQKKPQLAVSRGSIVSIYENGDETASTYRVSASIMPGSSGGGLWTEDGKLVGLTVSIIRVGGVTAWDHSFVTASEHLVGLLPLTP